MVYFMLRCPLIDLERKFLQVEWWWWIDDDDRQTLIAWPSLTSCSQASTAKKIGPTIKRPQWRDSGSIIICILLYEIIYYMLYCLYLIAAIFFLFHHSFYFSCFSIFFHLDGCWRAIMSTKIGVDQRRIAGVLYVYNPTGVWASWAQYMSGVYI